MYDTLHKYKKKLKDTVKFLDKINKLTNNEHFFIKSIQIKNNIANYIILETSLVIPIQKTKIKSKENDENKYNETLLEINEIQDKIRSDRIKLRIRMKIQKKSTTINELT